MTCSVRASGGIFFVPDMVTSVDTFGTNCVLVTTPFQTAASDAKGTEDLPALDPFALEFDRGG